MFEQHDRVIVLASGPSVLSVKPEQVKNAGAVVISVNTAIEWVGWSRYWFTLDPMCLPKRIWSNRVEGCKYVLCGPNDFDHPKWCTRLDRVAGNMFGKLRAKPGLSDDAQAVHTGNSAYGALGVAYHMRPKKILLLGVDANDSTKIDGSASKPGWLDHLPKLFASALPQLSSIEVVNGSPHSAIDCFNKMTPSQGLEWISA